MITAKTATGLAQEQRKGTVSTIMTMIRMTARDGRTSYVTGPHDWTEEEAIHISEVLSARGFTVLCANHPRGGVEMEISWEDQTDSFTMHTHTF